jgi:hypothetical protein
MTPTFKDAYKHIASLPGRVKAVTAGVVAAGIAALALGFFSAGGGSPAVTAPPVTAPPVTAAPVTAAPVTAPLFPNSVSAPAGYEVTYAHDFTTQGMGDWVTQPRAGATVSVSSSDGLGVGLTGENQWAEVISSDAVIGPNSFVQGLVYIPPGPNGSTANWPAFWSTGSPWPKNGEIDMLEGQEGRSCEQTHYGVLQPHDHASGDSVSKCGPHGSSSTGWLTVSMLRTGEQVEVWYNKTFIGKVPLPTTANQELIFQNQDGPNDGCSCNGPLVFPSTAWLSRVAVWSEG